MASSRVGTRINAIGTTLAAVSIICSAGRANAAVLPVPVAAWPSRSRPASRWGMVSRWIGVGSSYPRSAMVFNNSGRRPRVSNPSPSSVLG